MMAAVRLPVTFTVVENVEAPAKVALLPTEREVPILPAVAATSEPAD